MASSAASSGRRAFIGLDRINLEGLRFRLIDAEGQVRGSPYLLLHLLPCTRCMC